MEWSKRQLIYKPAGDREWSRTHAQVPTALRVDERRMRIYFGTRDATHRTLTTFIDVDANEPHVILAEHDRPVLELGCRGAFDDCGVMPSWVVRRGGEVYLYYIGWNVADTVRYRLSIGLAVSDDDGITFRRYAAGPIMDRSIGDPFFVSNPCVLADDGGAWRMWYLSCTKWEMIGELSEPYYHIKYAESDDGINWRRGGQAAIELAGDEAGLARPCVIKRDNEYCMWYCYRKARGYRDERSASYRIGFARSADGAVWTRRDGDAGIPVSEGGWDADMIAYPFVYTIGERAVMLYNGNGFGTSGFGYAVADWQKKFDERR